MRIETVVPNITDASSREWEIHLKDLSPAEFEQARCLLHAVFKYGQFPNAKELAQEVSIKNAILDHLKL